MRKWIRAAAALVLALWLTADARADGASAAGAVVVYGAAVVVIGLVMSIAAIVIGFLLLRKRGRESEKRNIEGTPSPPVAQQPPRTLGWAMRWGLKVSLVTAVIASLIGYVVFADESTPIDGRILLVAAMAVVGALFGFPLGMICASVASRRQHRLSRT
jgi:hypothetical protein